MPFICNAFLNTSAPSQNNSSLCSEVQSYLWEENTESFFKMKPLTPSLADSPEVSGRREMCSDLEFGNMGLWVARKTGQEKKQT